MAIEGFEITKASDVDLKLRKYRDNYNTKGQYLGFADIDKHYSMMLGTCTDWTGFPMSGKTQVLMELLMNTSKYYGWKHLVYFPDVGNNVEIIADLIHKKTGKSFNPDSHNAITDAEIANEINWITHHFKILTKSNVKAKMTPFQFWDFAVELKKSEGLETACIDSWKDLSHPYNEFGGYATYLEVVLPYRNQIAEDNNLHLHTIIHPKLTEKVQGKRLAPTPYDLKGGSEWFNSGKCMVTVHREDITTNQVQIFFNKIKPRSCGSVGDCVLHFDLDKLVYYQNELKGNYIEKIYASPNDAPMNKQQVNTSLNRFQSNFENDLPF
jgi:hypothetical protein